MDKQMSAAERVRPILQAMERSVDAARRRRLLGDAPAVESGPKPEVSDLGARGEPSRLKARPKRPGPQFGSDPLRARAS